MTTIFATLALLQVPGNGVLGPIFMYGAIFAIFYFILIRPQSKQRKEHDLLIRAVKKGDEVVTAGGVIGEVIHIKGDIVIDRSVEDVFDYVADERNEPTYNAQMRLAEKISDGPIGVGTQYRAEVMSGGRPISMVIEVTGYERPRRLASKTTMSSMDIAYTLTFEPVREGDLLVLEFRHALRWRRAGGACRDSE